MKTQTMQKYGAAVVLAGSLWGLAEATLGYLLHLLPRIAGIPSLSGVLMFPVGLAFMLWAIRSTGRANAAFSVAVVAAAIKSTSLVLPMVSFVFVRNPVLAILAEGAVVALGVGAFTMNQQRATGPMKGGRTGTPVVLGGGGTHSGGTGSGALLGLGQNAWVIPMAFGLSVAWRGLFLGVNLALGIRGGIMMKPLPAIMSFLWLDSLFNTIVIAGAALIGNEVVRRRRPLPAYGGDLGHRPHRPGLPVRWTRGRGHHPRLDYFPWGWAPPNAMAVSALVLAIGVEISISAFGG